MEYNVESEDGVRLCVNRAVEMEAVKRGGYWILCTNSHTLSFSLSHTHTLPLQMEVDPGHTIIQQGDKGNFFYVVESGSFKILVNETEVHFECLFVYV